MTPEVSAQQIIRAYHQRTKHRFEAYAAGPETLDWDSQPAPFRHFAGAPCISLPALAETAQQPAILAALQRPFHRLTDTFAAIEYSLDSISVFLQLSLGITAWKSYGPDRWAVRANPSSGNLHPIEAYLFVQGVAGLSDGLYHYCPDTHSLERRAETCPARGTPQMLVGLSSMMWREAWKYGERAFRYCQLDTGHAAGALAYAAAVLGWRITEQRHVETDNLAELLGLSRNQDFPAHRHAKTEHEEAEMLFAVSPWPLTSAEPPAPKSWHGNASTIDGHPMYHWPVIEEVAIASRLGAENFSGKHLPHSPASSATAGRDIPAASIILGRRSAQRFDSRHVMPRKDFVSLLQALQPCDQVPWNSLSCPPCINLLLFIHRVEGFESGLYLLVRTPRLAKQLDKAMDCRFLRTPVADTPENVKLSLLTPALAAELHRAARSLHCHQDIASNACFAVGMLAEFDAPISAQAAHYRDLHREAGLIGQALYLQAEACGLRGTGIGCFFDDPVHELLGLQDSTFQTIYHFTVGLPLDDPRIETIPIHIPATADKRQS